MDYLNRLRMPFNVNRLAQVAARAALQDTDFLARTRELVLEGKDLLLPGAGPPRADVYPQPGQFRAHPGPPAGARSLSGHAAGRGHHPGHGLLRFPRLYPDQYGTAGGKPAVPGSITEGIGVGRLSGPPGNHHHRRSGRGRQKHGGPPLGPIPGLPLPGQRRPLSGRGLAGPAAGSRPGPRLDPGRVPGGLCPGADRRFPGISPGDRRRRGEPRASGPQR